MSSCHLLLGRPLDLFRLLGCHSVHRLVHLLSFNLAIWPAHFHFCFSVYSMISMIFVLFLISAHGILSFSFRSNIFLSIALWAVLSLFVICLFRDHGVSVTSPVYRNVNAEAFPWCQSQKDLHLFCKFRMTCTWTKNIEKSSYQDWNFSGYHHKWVILLHLTSRISLCRTGEREYDGQSLFCCPGTEDILSHVQVFWLPHPYRQRYVMVVLMVVDVMIWGDTWCKG